MVKFQLKCEDGCHAATFSKILQVGGDVQSVEVPNSNDVVFHEGKVVANLSTLTLTVSSRHHMLLLKVHVDP